MYSKPRFVLDRFGRWQFLSAPPPQVVLHLDDADVAAVRYGILLLSETLPDINDRVFREFDSMKLGGIRVCGPNTLACTLVPGDLRTLYFTERPSERHPVDLAITIGHESLHHFTTDDGVHYRIDHTCTDCRDPWQRANDHIYVWETRVRPLLQATHARLAAPPSAPAYAYGSYFSDYREYHHLWR